VSHLIISVNNLGRTFRSTKKKEEGLRGTFKLLFRPEYQTRVALEGISFEIQEGSITGLIGANGAGKTTLIKIMAGLLPPTSGEARVLGVTPFDRPLSFRQQISLVMGQKAQLWWDLPAIDAFDLIRSIYQIPKPVYRKRLKHMTELLDVAQHTGTQLRRLSLGERMKMELIGALLHWPRVIFLDEPTIGLDVVAAHHLREFLREFNQEEGATLILTSHNMDDIERLCSRVLILRSGRILSDTTAQALLSSEQKTLKLRFAKRPGEDALHAALKSGGFRLNAEALERNPRHDRGSGHLESSNFIHIYLKKDQILGVLTLLSQRFEILEIGIDEQDLEQVIQRLFLKEGQR